MCVFLDIRFICLIWVYTRGKLFAKDGFAEDFNSEGLSYRERSFFEAEAIGFRESSFLETRRRFLDSRVILNVGARENFLGWTKQYDIIFGFGTKIQFPPLTTKEIFVLPFLRRGRG